MSSIIERFKNEEFVVNCKTEEQAKEFVKICYDNDIKWFESKSSVTNWESYEKFTCYRAEDGHDLMYCNTDFYREEEYTVITFDEFMKEYRDTKRFAKADLKSGMLVGYRNGDYVLVTESKDGFLLVGDGFCHHLADYDDDLMEINGDDDFDIIEIYDLPTEGVYSLYALIDPGYRTLLWEEVKELTVEEISELLGYKVKVVGGKD